MIRIKALKIPSKTPQGGQQGGHWVVSYCADKEGKGLQNLYSAVRIRSAPPS